jgi:hypothetical protein
VDLERRLDFLHQNAEDFLAIGPGLEGAPIGGAGIAHGVKGRDGFFNGVTGANEQNFEGIGFGRWLAGGAGGQGQSTSRDGGLSGGGEAGGQFSSEATGAATVGIMAAVADVHGV